MEKSRASACEGEAGRINGGSGEAIVELIVQPIDKGEEHLLVAAARQPCSRAGWNAMTERQGRVLGIQMNTKDLLMHVCVHCSYNLLYIAGIHDKNNKKRLILSCYRGSTSQLIFRSDHGLNKLQNLLYKVLTVKR